MPDAKAIGHFRRLLLKTGKDKTIWEQFELKGITVKNGTIQDATFITLDPDHGNYKKDKGDTMKYLDQESVTQAAENKDGKKDDKTKNKGRGADAKTRRSQDGTWTKKNDKLYFGYKFHTSVARKSSVILNYSVTTASDHDSQIDLSMAGVIVYRVKGYYGVETRGIDGTMDKKSKGRRQIAYSIDTEKSKNFEKTVYSRKAICSDKKRISWRSCIGNNGDQGSSKSNVYVLST
ncbi:MAG: hypothetical protein QXT72_04185 [Candidatus Micrarchaeia archaeon]